MSNLYDGVKFLATNAGTGPFTVGAAVPSFLTPAQASVPNNTSSIPFAAYIGAQRMWGLCTYNAGVITINSVRGNSLGTTALINFTSPPTVFFDVQAEDISGGGGSPNTITLTADTDIAAGSSVSVNASGHAVQTWGPAPQVDSTIIIPNPNTFGYQNAPNSISNQQPPVVALGDGSFLFIEAGFKPSATGGTNLSVTPATATDEGIVLGTADAQDAPSFSALIFIPLTSTTFVSCYIDGQNAYALLMAVGTISAGAISYGDPVTLSSNSSSKFQSGTALSATSGVVAFSDAANSGNASFVAFSISGSTLALGSAQAVTNAAINVKVGKLSSSSFVGVMDNAGATNVLAGVVGAVSGTAITIGPLTNADDSLAAADAGVGLTILDSTHFVAVSAGGPILNTINSSLTGTVGTVSGTGLTWGATATAVAASTSPASGWPPFIPIATLDSTHVALAANLALPLVGTVTDGNTLAFSTSSPVNSDQPQDLSGLANGFGGADGFFIPNFITDLVYTSIAVLDQNHFIVADARANIFSVETSGSNIAAISAPIKHHTTWNYFVFPLNSTTVLATFTTWDGAFTARLIKNNPVANGPIGFTSSAVLESGTATIQTSGVAPGLTDQAGDSLTPGATYYHNGDGSIVTANTGHKAGVALTDSTLLIAA
jgi:hypothetical protein